MNKIFLCVGAPASGKSTWAKAEINKDSENWARINNDDIRAMLNCSNWSFEYEKFVTETRNWLIKEALRRGKNIIIDNVNANKRHFKDTCDIARAMNRDIQIIEKPFYAELEDLLERDSKREGKARVGEEVVKKWFKELGGKMFKFYKPKTEIIFKNQYQASFGDAPSVVEGVPDAIMCDLDGTVSLFNKIGEGGRVEVMYPAAHARNPYDASNCDQDMLNEAVASVIRTYAAKGTAILFCSGRKREYEPQTRAFLDKHFPDIKYSLFMRATADNRKDSIIKEEIYINNINGQYNVLFVLDDRDQVVAEWRKLGLNCFQVAPGAF